jgi:hypothetical protein
MRIFGNGAQLDIEGTSMPITLLSLLTDEELSRRYIGASTVVRTKYGIRFPTATPAAPDGALGDEIHRDQSLACLAEFGVPLSQGIVLASGTSTLQHVLEDSLANFHLEQREIAWTALAYAVYLPSVRQWRNRFGRVFCFDDLAKELLQRGMKGSCGGIHQLVAMTALVRVDAVRPVLSEEVRTRLHAYVSRFVDLAIRSQQPDGSWSIHWNHSLAEPPDTMEASAADTPSSRLLVTGHLGEWMTCLPSDCKVPDATRKAAVSWLRQRLKEINVQRFSEGFCPYTHAICAVRDLAG